MYCVITVWLGKFRGIWVLMILGMTSSTPLWWIGLKTIVNPMNICLNLVYLGSLCSPKLFDRFGCIGIDSFFRQEERSPT